MTAVENTPKGGLDSYAQARKLAEQALHEQAVDHPEAADRLGAEVLAEHDAAHEPDARDRRTADHEVERIIRPTGSESHTSSGTGKSPERARS